MVEKDIEYKIKFLNRFLDDMEDKGGEERLKMIGFMRAYQLTMVTQERQAKIDIIEFLDKSCDGDIPVNGFTEFMVRMSGDMLH